MTNLVVIPKTNTQLKQIEKLLKAMGVVSRAVSDEDIEDFLDVMEVKKVKRTPGGKSFVLWKEARKKLKAK